MKTENLSTLKIHQLSQKQYDREFAAGRIDENAIYLTPYEDTFVTKEYVDSQRIAWDNSFTIEWDGNTEGKEPVETMDNIKHYRVCEDTVDFDLINEVVMKTFLSEEGQTYAERIWVEKQYNGMNADVLFADFPGTINLPVAINAYDYIAEVNAPGLYFMIALDIYYTASIGCIDLHTIDPKFLPEGIFATQEELNTLASKISSLNTALENTLEGVES